MNFLLPGSFRRNRTDLYAAAENALSDRPRSWSPFASRVVPIKRLYFSLGITQQVSPLSKCRLPMHSFSTFTVFCQQKRYPCRTYTSLSAIVIRFSLCRTLGVIVCLFARYLYRYLINIVSDKACSRIPPRVKVQVQLVSRQADSGLYQLRNTRFQRNFCAS